MLSVYISEITSDDGKKLPKHVVEDNESIVFKVFCSL